MHGFLDPSIWDADVSPWDVVRGLVIVLVGFLVLFLTFGSLGWGLEKIGESHWWRRASGALADWRDETALYVRRMRQQHRIPKKLPVTVGQLAAIESFATVVAEIQRDSSLEAYTKGVLIVQTYENSLQRLAASGDLTPNVEQEFRSFTEACLRQIQGLTEELGASLTELIERYRPELIRRPRWPGTIRTRP